MENKKFCLIGNPVEHSRSPKIHNTLASLRNDALEYSLCRLEENELEDFVKRSKEEGLAGFNITVPYKEKIMPYLVSISKEALAIGAVNTAKLTKDGYIGTNTDYSGLARDLRDHDVFVKGRDTVVIGAGGASRGVLAALILEGAKSVTVFNRTFETAKKLCDEMNRAFETDICVALERESFEALNDNLVVVQTTSLGLHGENAFFESPSFYKKVAVGVDIVPVDMTDFRRRCKEAGAKEIDGYGMLLNQAVDAYEFWLDCKVSREDVDTVRRKVFYE